MWVAMWAATVMAMAAWIRLFPIAPATIAGIVALLVFALLCGLTARGTVAAQDVLGLSLPPYLQFLFAVTGLLVAATLALAMRGMVLQMTRAAVAAETTSGTQMSPRHGRPHGRGHRHVGPR